ncbi:MAG: precorrin-4 C(11)-methyltransferase, partial [Alistipes sp.]|nr:precorrin-4 C(11)-methyltransferase [Alistipes sp.]
MQTAVINISPAGETIARRVAESLNAERLDLADLNAESWASHRAFVFVGAMGICVRSVAPFIKDKHT